MKILMLLLFVSCAKVRYITNQGIGQIGLEWNGRDNKDLLADNSIDKEIKRKIHLIGKAKNYFYDFYHLEPSSIYEETTILKSDAVTYLVVHSPAEEIKAIKTSFPIVGSFPYLGFFSKEDALNYKNEKMSEGYHTYMRPVYAYSTLNQWVFKDNILSSFFNYSDEALVEMIFHELVHTVLFVKNNVQFNESFAQFISEKMVVDYFHFGKEKQKEIFKNKQINRLLNKKIKELSLKLSKEYASSTNPAKTLEDFNNKVFKKQIKNFCQKNSVKHCWPSRQVWNNARFAALGTYENKRSDLEELYVQKNIALKDFFLKSKKVLEKYDRKVKIIDYLKKEI